MFELAQLAESSVYTNPLLCAVNIRQLAETFINVLLSESYLKGAWDKITLPEGENAEPYFKAKQIGLTNFINTDYQFNANYNYCKKVFPRYPGKLNTLDRPTCPEGQGNDRFKDGSFVDPDKKSLYVWNFIAYLGNIGAHAVLSEEKKLWLKQEYLLEALEQLYVRLGTYFYKHEMNKAMQLKFDKNKLSMSNRQIFYPHPNGSGPRSIEEYDVLPSYVEAECVSVNHSLSNDKWESEGNRFALVRRFSKPEKSIRGTFQDYLLRAPKAYTQVQRFHNTPELARVSVLVDLQQNADYYVTAYEFDTQPLRLDESTLSEMAKEPQNIVRLFAQIAVCLAEMGDAGVYHRNLRREGVRVCKKADGSFSAQIIDLELCKVFEEEGQNLGTLMRPAKADSEKHGESVDYNREWTREEYSELHIQRLGRLIKEIVETCPGLCQYPLIGKLLSIADDLVKDIRGSANAPSMRDVVKKLRNLENGEQHVS
jgi:hypothetical protein